MSDDLYYTDLREPERIKKFFSRFLVHSKGTHAGKPFNLLDWQYDIIKDLFGTYKTADNLRRYRNGLVLIPRKNGKTTLEESYQVQRCCGRTFGNNTYTPTCATQSNGL